LWRGFPEANACWLCKLGVKHPRTCVAGFPEIDPTPRRCASSYDRMRVVLLASPPSSSFNPKKVHSKPHALSRGSGGRTLLLAACADAIRRNRNLWLRHRPAGLLDRGG